MPRVRFTLRYQMFAVATVGVMLGGIVHGVELHRRSLEFRRLADEHDRKEWAATMRAAIPVHRGSFVVERCNSRLEPDSDAQDAADSDWDARMRAWDEERPLLWRERAAYHAALSRKYRAAASRPWATVLPDPPSPPEPPPEPEWIFPTELIQLDAPWPPVRPSDRAPPPPSH